MATHALEEPLRQLETERIIARIWEKDPAVWRAPGQDVREITDRLGWLAAPETMQGQAGEIADFAQTAMRDGFTHAVLLGMGGSSLAPYVLACAFGTAAGFLNLYMLDSTVPAAIHHCESQIDLAHTLFIVASKSGGTIETLSLYKHFWAKVAASVDDAGRQFIAITDPGSGLEALARQQGFRAVFLNPPDIGGRYSALSLFGLIPAALIGMDINLLLQSGREMAQRCGPNTPIHKNPGAVLGAFMGTMARHRRDKLILAASPQIRDFGLWAEQLIAESTGKEGKGILPVIADGGASRLASTCPDCAVVRLRFADELVSSPTREDSVPAFTRNIPDVYALAGEFYCWEMATTVAGHILGIHPFDQPNVAQAKRATAEVLAEYERAGSLPRIAPDWEQDGLSLNGTNSPVKSLSEAMTAYTASVQERGYCALLAYISPDGTWDAPLRALQEALASRCGAAATVGYGPRYLHSTGQLHKGGPAGGHFVVLTAHDAQDIPIPDEPYTFAVLKNAQAMGDIRALRAANRRVLHIHAGQDLAAAFSSLLKAISIS